MTLAEFLIREYGYKRSQQWDWAKYRMVAFLSVRAFNIDPKSIPKNESDIVNLPFVDGVEKSIGISDAQLKAIENAQKEYERQLKLRELNG